MNGTGTTAEQRTPEEIQDMISAAFSGDSAAFGTLVTMYQQPVYSMCMRYLKGEDARDAAQEVFIKAFVHRQRFSADKSVLPWLLTIAKNLCIDRIRKNRHEVPGIAEMSEPSSSAPNAEQHAVSRQTLNLVEQEIRQLPDGQREALVLHHVEGLPYKEVSDVLGVPQGTVMTWLHRGRNTLMQALNRSEKRGKI
ncbi:MAG: RNA polymerase sigma factor [Deltaproteobacteria bacterium]|nr:RNA polymerase sigma factor [Deltaproteobacteria bacterium]MBN2673156.1 RNA polymerase sigma factor [Deltaproteobacteria bacterium]